MARTLCRNHYNIWRRQRPDSQGCSIAGCDGAFQAREWCDAHYKRWLKTGDPEGVTARPRPSELQRFLSKVNKDGPIPAYAPHLGPCWLWTASQSGNGYGQFYYSGRIGKAHRFAYEALAEPIPAGLDLDHLCRIRHCVNPAHLEPVTRRENILRGETLPSANARKVACSKGHPYDEKNTRVTKRGYRRCRICEDERKTNRKR